MATVTEKPLAGKWMLNFKGVHNFENLYKMMFEFLTSRGFVHPEGDENIEEYYNEVILPGGGAKNVWFWWRTVKKHSELFDLEIDVDCQLLVHKKKEIMHNNQKIKTHDGEILLSINARVIFDRKEKWQKGAISQLLWDYIYRYHYRSQIDNNEDDLFDIVNDLFERVKQYLGLMTLSDRAPLFHPEGGYPQPVGG
ncbi:MAG: hypothetical protein ACMXYF_05105 [Candidatus Woesearchaeota archaeon]